MSDLEVKIVQMEPMRVAFAEEKGIDPKDARFFGFNNPNPSPGSPNYGYEQWMTVGPDVKAEGEITVKEIPARQYAVARCEGLSTIGEVWRQLVLWFEDSPYKQPSHWCECLEELLTPPGVPPEDFVFDLYLPIAE